MAALFAEPLSRTFCWMSRCREACSATAASWGDADSAITGPGRNRRPNSRRITRRAGYFAGCGQRFRRWETHHPPAAASRSGIHGEFSGSLEALTDHGIIREEQTLGDVRVRLDDPFFADWLRTARST